MKSLITLVFMLSVLTACNFKEGLKETGGAVQGGVQNTGEALKQALADIK